MPLKLVPPRIGKTPFWSVRGTHLGVYLDRSTKTGSRATAGRILARWKAEIECGATAKPGEPTFLDAAVKYMALRGDDRFLEPITVKLGARPLRAIDQKMLDDAALELYPTASAATRNRQFYTPVSAVLKQAGVEWQIKRPKGWRGNNRTAWYWPEQAFRIFEEADKIDAEFGLFLRFMTYTGSRLSEATRAFQVNDLSLPEAIAYFERTKNSDPRTVFLPPALVAALANHPRGLHRKGQTVFRFRKNGRIYALLKKVREALAGEFHVHGFHCFRHTWATWMRRYGGLDTRGLLATEAWRDAASVRRYEHVIATEESQKAALLPFEPIRGEVVDSVKKPKKSANA